MRLSCSWVERITRRPPDGDHQEVSGGLVEVDDEVTIVPSVRCWDLLPDESAGIDARHGQSVQEEVAVEEKAVDEPRAHRSADHPGAGMERDATQVSGDDDVDHLVEDIGPGLIDRLKADQGGLPRSLVDVVGDAVQIHQCQVWALQI